MRAVIICGGDIGSYERAKKQIKKEDMIICADSGYEHAKKMNVTPYAVLGDFDSCDIAKIECENIKTYPVKKDFTDSEIAAKYVVEHGADEILFLASTGGRIDHALANIYLLKTMFQNNVSAAIFDGISTLWYCAGKISVKGNVGDLLSVIPFSDVGEITTRGLMYELTAQPLPSTGVSNVFVSCNASVEVGSGEAIIVYTPSENI